VHVDTDSAEPANEHGTGVQARRVLQTEHAWTGAAYTSYPRPPRS
jgi:hypothetical protein